MVRFAPLAALALGGCVTVYPPDAPRDVGYARLGETARLGGVAVTPLSLVEDSRCPRGVSCVWAGRVRIAARIGGATRELTLGQPASVAGGAVTLVEVSPARRRDTAIAARDYRFGFRLAP